MNDDAGGTSAHERAVGRPVPKRDKRGALTAAETMRAVTAELRINVQQWHPKAYSWQWRDCWVIYDGREVNKTLARGSTEVEAWADAATSMPPNDSLSRPQRPAQEQR